MHRVHVRRSAGLPAIGLGDVHHLRGRCASSLSGLRLKAACLEHDVSNIGSTTAKHLEVRARQLSETTGLDEVMHWRSAVVHENHVDLQSRSRGPDAHVCFCDTRLLACTADTLHYIITARMTRLGDQVGDARALQDALRRRHRAVGERRHLQGSTMLQSAARSVRDVTPPCAVGVHSRRPFGAANADNG